MTTTTAEKKAEKKRVRQVYDTGMVPHLWARQTQGSARNPQGNLFFEGDTLYSYRSSYPIARHVERKGKGKAVLVQLDTYSKTTTGHIQDARRALSRENGPMFTVPDLGSSSWGAREISENEHGDNWKSYLDRIEETAAKAKRAKSNKDWLLGRLAALASEANAYSAYFGLRKRVKHADDLDALMGEAAARKAEIRKAELKRDKERKARLEADNAERLRCWLAGDEGISVLYGLSSLDKTYLRVVRCAEWDEAGNRLYEGEPNTIQTSKGASFPLEHAKRVWPLLKRLHDAGETYAHNGHTIHLGEFRIDSVDSSGTVTAGCHVVTWDEIERIAKLLGLD
jgi:hypothetical protein